MVKVEEIDNNTYFLENQSKIDYVNERISLLHTNREHAKSELNKHAKAIQYYWRSVEDSLPSLLNEGDLSLPSEFYHFETFSNKQVKENRKTLLKNLDGIERPQGLPSDLEQDIADISNGIYQARELTQQVGAHCKEIHKNLEKIKQSKMALLRATLRLATSVSIAFFATITGPTASLILSAVSICLAVSALFTYKKKNEQIKICLTGCEYQKYCLNNLKIFETLENIRFKLNLPKFSTPIMPDAETPPQPRLQLSPETLDPLNWFAATTPGAS